MTWRRLTVIVFWVVVVTVLAQRWYVSSVHIAPPPEPGSLATPVEQPKIKGPVFVVKDYTVVQNDPYHFEVHYKVINIGDKAAKNIRVKIYPWLHATVPGGTGEQIAEDAPIRKEGKFDIITRLAPGETIERVLYFNGVEYATPAEYMKVDEYDFKFDVEP